MIPIEETKRIDWNAIRAEYIGGGISQRKLADKHGIPVDKLLKIANREHWKDDREKASNKAAMKAQQKTAVAAADNALRLSRAEQKFPMDATEVRTQVGKSTAIFKLRDLTAMYRDLTEDMAGTSADNALLQSLLDLERRAAR